MTLAQLSMGGRAVIRNIEGTDDISMRLWEMGLTPGSEITLLGRAPLGDPLEFEIRGYRLSLRRSEAARVEIQAID